MATTLSNYVITMTALKDDFLEWVCVERIVWRSSSKNGNDLLEVHDGHGKSFLEPIRLGVGGRDREIDMHGKWADGLEVVEMGDAQDTHQLDFYLRQTKRRKRG